MKFGKKFKLNPYNKIVENRDNIKGKIKEIIYTF